jgi:carboxyl-terminal processing protease
MRACLFLWVVVLGMSAVIAAPRPLVRPATKDRKQLRIESRRFAQQLHGLLDQIAVYYIRPVSREDLTMAALVGLYQAARMSPPRDLRQQVRQAVAMSSLVQTSVPGVIAASRSPQDPLERLLAELREKVGAPDALAGQDAGLICCKAMARLLDPHSGIVTAEEQRRSVGLDNESYGTGLEMRDNLGVGPLVVDAVQLGSPAQRLGLRPGDVITHIDGQPVKKAPPAKLLALHNQRVVPEAPVVAPPDAKEQEKPAHQLETIEVRYRRPGEEESHGATLLRERFRPETILGVNRRDDNSWNYLLDEKRRTAFVRVATLSRGTSEELRSVLSSLRDHKVTGLVLDLRWCPGGYLTEAVDVADLFLGNVAIATVKSRGKEDMVYRSSEQNKFLDFTVVVLVNGDTSGGAELIAAALQDHDRAVVVGQRTRGKASVQTPVPIGVEGVGFKLTSGTFLRPSGKNLHRFPDSKPSDDWGVIPSEDCRVSAALGKRLHQWWQLYSLRPCRSRERMALDDPRADPQQLVAQRVLLARLAMKTKAQAMAE